MTRAANRAIWVKRVAAFERSGLSRPMWCAGNGVGVASLDYWRARLRGSNDSECQALVPIVVSARTTARASRIGPCQIEIEMGTDLRLRTSSDVDAHWLSTLLLGLR